MVKVIGNLCNLSYDNRVETIQNNTENKVSHSLRYNYFINYFKSFYEYSLKKIWAVHTIYSKVIQDQYLLENYSDQVGVEVPHIEIEKLDTTLVKAINGIGIK